MHPIAFNNATSPPPSLTLGKKIMKDNQTTNFETMIFCYSSLQCQTFSKIPIYSQLSSWNELPDSVRYHHNWITFKIVHTYIIKKYIIKKTVLTYHPYWNSYKKFTDDYFVLFFASNLHFDSSKLPFINGDSSGFFIYYSVFSLPNLMARKMLRPPLPPPPLASLPINNYLINDYLFLTHCLLFLKLLSATVLDRDKNRALALQYSLCQIHPTHINSNYCKRI